MFKSKVSSGSIQIEEVELAVVFVPFVSNTLVVLCTDFLAFDDEFYCFIDQFHLSFGLTSENFVIGPVRDEGKLRINE